MLTSQRFQVQEESQVGEVRRVVADLSKHHHLSETDAGKLAISVTELARNLVRHGRGGEIVIREIPSSPAFGIELLSIDRGPGIKNIAEAFRDGFSTGGTSGTGLGAVRRLAGSFDIFTQVDKGTIVRCFIGSREPTAKFQVGAISVPVHGEELCGDRWDCMEHDSEFSLILADGLGHGPFAEEAAREAIAIFREHPSLPPAEIMNRCHLALGKTRGAAGAMINIRAAARRLVSAGIGNIAMRLVSETSTRSLVSDNGTLGGNARNAHETSVAWEPETVFVMHSDGLGSHWNLKDYPGVAMRHPSVIAALLYRDHRRERDDSTVVVLKERS